jgi:peptidoglycan/xylan/chitin deacetylase (PgdA/CDA1 family)
MKSGDNSRNGEKTTGTAYYHAKIDPNKPMVALTFDDGPSIYTPAILKQLKKYNAHATFFVVGERVSSYAKTIKQANKQGCEIGSHSYSHANLGTASAATIDSQLNKTEKRIKKILGFYTPIMRPPYGSINDTLRKRVGKPMILWSIDTLDWKTRNANSTVKAIMSKVKDGDIVLMHDLYSASRDAALTVIPKLIKKGYQLVTVSEMADYKGYTLQDGKAYTSIKNTKK